MEAKVLIVGESNPYGADPHFALYPSPEGCSGWRLCVVVLGMRRAEYLERFDRTNLLAGAGWSAGAAREAAGRLRAGRDRFVLLGRRVAAAFDLAAPPFSLIEQVVSRFVLLPHPSGWCRAWNEPGAAERARLLVRRLEEA